MAPQARSLQVRLRPFTSTASFHARSLRLSSCLGRAVPNAKPPTISRAPAIPRAFSQISPAARRFDSRPDPKQVDYDPSYGDPWLPYRLRTAKPLFELPRTAPEDGARHQEIPQNRTYRLPARPVILTFMVVTLLALLFYWRNLEVVPVSGRKRFNCYSEAAVLKQSRLQYDALLHRMAEAWETMLPAHDPRVRQVRRVMARLIPFSGMAGEWEVHVINNKSLAAANAFVLPGGKVFVFSGLLRIAHTDGQLAAVLSHEIAHNAAAHGAETLSARLGDYLFLGSMVLLLAATPIRSFRRLGGLLVGVAALNLLFKKPIRRIQENEADYAGLMMMAEACYDPRDAVAFWARVDQLQRESGMEIPEWLSTHPTHGHRIERITKWMPEALEKREKSDCVGTQSFADAFWRALERIEVFVHGM